MSRQRLDEIGQYTIVPKWVQYRLRKEPFALQVYAWLGTYANRDAEAWPKRERLAEDLDVSVRSIGRALETLRASDCIETKLRHNPANGAVVGMMFKLRQAEPVDDLLQDTTDLKDSDGHKDTRGLKAARQKDKSGTPKGTHTSRLYKEELDPIELDPIEIALGGEQEPGKRKEPPASSRIIARYCEQWKGRYGIKADVSGADGGQAKRIADDPDYAIADVLEALDAYVASDEPYYTERRHPLALFCSNVGKLIAGVRHKAGPSASPARDARRAALVDEAAAAINALERDAHGRLIEIVECELLRLHPDLKTRVPLADYNGRLALAAVNFVIENGRGRSMAATITDLISVEVAS